MEERTTGIKLTYHGHSCFLVEYDGWRIVVDPYDGHVPGYAPLRLSAHQVFCSHEHMDHYYLAGVTLFPAEGRQSPFIVEEYQIPHDDAGGSLRGMNKIRVFSAGGLRVAHMGDIGCAPGTELLTALRGVDAVLIPVGGVYTITGRQARAIADALRPRVVIPMHYRQGELGLRPLDTLEPFLSVSSDVVQYDGNAIAIDSKTPSQTAVLRYLKGV